MTPTEKRAAVVRLLALDVDGVLTDGLIYYGNSGDELKSFNIKDGLGIKLLQKTGVKVALITGRQSQIVARRAHELGIEVIALPGPSSLLLALAASGLNGQCFAFVGYLPVEATERNTRIRDLETLSRRLGQTQLMIETPYRNDALLSALLASLNAGTKLSVSCGLTLAGAFTRSGTVAQWKANPKRLPADVPVVFSLLAA